MTGFITCCTQDGTWLAHDSVTGISVSGRSLTDALAELRRRLSNIVEHAA